MKHKKDYYNLFFLICLISLPLLIGLYSIKLGQDINWDLLNYHLYNPYAYIHDRLHLDLAPAGLQTYFNPFIDLAYFHALSFLEPKSLGFLIGFFQGISIILLYMISKQVIGNHKGYKGYALFLGLAGVLSVGFISEIGTVLNDSLVGLFPLTSLLLMLLAIDRIDNEPKKAIVLINISSVIIGIGCGLKLTLSIYAISLLIGILIIPIKDWRFRLKIAFLFGWFSFFGLVLSGGYWFYEIWKEFGNPIFPQFNHIFHGDLALFESGNDIRFLPKNFYEKMLYPIIFTINPLRVGELEYKQISWIFGYIALIFLLISYSINFKKIRSIGSYNIKKFFIIMFFGVSYLLWLNIFGIYRYTIPIEIILPLLIFIAINHCFKTAFTNLISVIFITVITLVNLRGTPDFGHSSWSDLVYRIDVTSPLSSSPEPAVVYLVGQPLAWIIPALHINASFIQLVPNILVSDTYWQRAKELAARKQGEKFVVLESASSATKAIANEKLAKLGLTFDTNECTSLVGYLGTTRYEYPLCKTKQLEIR